MQHIDRPDNVQMNTESVRSRSFYVKNVVRQGDVVNPVLFCVYFDGLLHMLRESNVGCCVGNVSWVR